MSQPTREKWTPRDKEVLAELLADGTGYKKRIDEATTNSEKFKVWSEICTDFCAMTNRQTVNHQKLRDMWKKEKQKLNIKNKVQYNAYLR